MNRAIESLLELEEQHDLWRRSVLGHRVWPQLRLATYNRLLENQHKAVDATSRQRALARAPASLRDLTQKLLPALSRHDLWVISSSMYRRNVEGRALNVFTSELERQLGERLVFLETNPLARPRVAQANVVFTDALYDAARTLAARTARALPEHLASGLPDIPGLGLSAFEVLREAVFGRLWRGVGELLIRTARPRALFVLCAYSHQSPLLLAARAHRIPVIELQHGVIHDSHPGYVFGPSFDPRHAPDRLIVFGEHYGQLLDRHSAYFRGRWAVGGHAWLKRRAETAQSLRGGDRDEPLVVLFGQNVIAVQQQLCDFALALRRACPSQVRILVKPHPAEKSPSTAYAAATEAGVRLASRDDDSYALLSRCRVAVSVFSTIAVEALAFRCSSVVLPSEHWFDELRLLLDAGFVRLASAASDIVSLLDAPSVPEERSELARRLFGVGEPRFDFGTLF